MLDHITDAIKDVVVVIVSLPQEGRSADHLVLLIDIGLVKKGSRVISQQNKNQTFMLHTY